MQIKIVYVSKSGSHAIAVASTKFGKISTEVSGWVKLEDDVTVGEVLDVPATKASMRTDITKDGTPFTKLVLE